MNMNAVKHLVIKDISIMRVPILIYWATGFLAVAIAIFGGSALGMMSSILFITALAVAGIHMIIQTVVTERTEQNLPFIMSMPINYREYTLAKIVANFITFTGIWLTLSAASFIVFIGDSMPHGTIPFYCVILMAIFLAYTIMLTVSLATNGMGPAVVVVTLANIGTQLYIWWFASFYEIRSVINGPEAVWNGTVVSMLSGQVLLVVLCVAAAVFVRFRQKDVI